MEERIIRKAECESRALLAGPRSERWLHGLANKVLKTFWNHP